MKRVLTMQAKAANINQLTVGSLNSGAYILHYINQL